MNTENNKQKWIKMVEETIELGIHTITCSECGEITIGYNSCRNRHSLCVKVMLEKNR